jgi:subtilisin-like proprotein convertase family protein
VKGPRIVVSRIVSLVVSAGLLAGLTFAVLATAQSQRPDTRRHLLLVPADAEGTAALARTDARLLARYESFSLVEAEGGDDERLRRAGAERRDDMRTVETAAGELDPRSDRSSLAAKEAPDRQETLALIQFVGPPKEAWLERLRQTGARILTYQAENAYVVHARGAAVDRLAALQGGHPAVRAVSVLTAADKLEDRSSGSGVFAITTATGTAGEEARDQAAALAGPAAAAPLTVGALRTEYRALSSSEVAELARDPGVVAVEAYHEPELLDERAAQIVAGNLNGSFQPTAPTYLDWVVDPSRIPNENTFDFAIDVTDEGLDNGALLTAHPDFREHGAGSITRVSYLANYTTDSNGRDCGGHGTNVASIAAGYNIVSSAPEYEDSSNYNHGLGVAPFARIGASKIFECDGGTSETWTPGGVAAAAYTGGARISNNSWGTKGEPTDRVWGEYTPQSAAYDQLVRDARPGGGADAGNQQMVEIFAAGNDGDDWPGDINEGYGTISTEGSAKNVITVGASESVRDSGTDGCGVTNGQANSARDIINFSSRGPTDDGRLKPDLVAPGTHITGAAPQHAGYHGDEMCNKFFTGTTRYSLVSGTSQAVPQVSGAAALVRHWYRRTQTGNTADPSPALTKALLVNTATDLNGGQDGKGSTIAAGPNSDQGWGRVNLGNTFDSTAREFRDQVPADLLSASGESRVRSYSVPDPSRPVKVTLAWTDAPGPTNGNPVVNNLDLVVDAGGRTYKGNVFAGALSRTGGTADPRNNVESVYLPAGAVTRLGVTVRATTIAGNGVPGVGDFTDQDYALVVSNADALAPTPVLSGEAPELSDPGPGGDDDGSLEPGEAFELDHDIRNGGDGTATGIDGTMSGPAPVSFTQPASSYPNTAPNTSSANVDQFVGQLSAAATCGADVTATLSLDTDQGIQQVPVVLPTGYPGAPMPQSSTNVPRSIPDDNSAGVTSSLTVSNPGVIKDVNVSIARITHGWVGDLSIQLTGPDGTTVKLAEQPGGPDNSGKNFVDTVFDDEAALNISSGSAPYTGSFRPQNDDLSRFDGKDKQGTWTLRVRDLFEGDEGTLEGWGTSTSTATCARNPQTTITAGPPADAFVESTSATFQFTGTETPGTPPFECRLDGQMFAPCQTNGSQSYTGLSEGQHTFEVRAIDAQGEADPSPAIRTWAVDTVGPAVDIDQPLTQSTISDATPTLTGSAGTAFGDLPTVTVEIRDSGGALVQTLTPTANGSTWSATAAQLQDGQYTVKVTQADQAGHVGEDTASFTLEGDFVAPAVSIDSPADGSSVADTTPTIAGTAGTAVGDASSVTVQIYSGPGATGTPIHTLSGVNVAGGRWSTETPQLALGSYSVRVSQTDSGGNTGSSPVVNFSVVDLTAPAVTVSSPANGSTTGDTTPQLAGSAGTASGDLPAVTVRIRTTGGGLVQELGTPASGGAWSTQAAALAEGTYTVTAQQSDTSGNVGTSAASTFTVDTPDPKPVTDDEDEAPSFVLAPAEERIADALAGRLTAIAACATACRVDARLSASSRAARSLGLGAKSAALGKGSKRLAGAGTAATIVRLNKRARTALRRRSTAKVSLRVKVTEGGRTLALSRTISLRRSAGLKRIASRGMRMWAVCSERCPLSGKLTLSAKDARRLGLKARGSARMQVASGRTTGTAGKPTRLTLKVRRGAKKALTKARKVSALLEAVAGTAPSRPVTRRITLRR